MTEVDAGAGDAGNVRILVIDPNVEDRTVLRAAVVAAGNHAAFVEVGNVSAAVTELRCAGHMPFDLIVYDGDEAGLQVLRGVRGHVPIVVHSRDRRLIARAVVRYSTDFVLKPAAAATTGASGAADLAAVGRALRAVRLGRSSDFLQRCRQQTRQALEGFYEVSMALQDYMKARGYG